MLFIYRIGFSFVVLFRVKLGVFSGLGLEPLSLESGSLGAGLEPASLSSLSVGVGLD